MAPPSPAPSRGPYNKLACSLCARRKVKCDKGEPCSSCVKARASCVYESLSTARRPRRKALDEELQARLTRYEELMQKHNVDFTPYVHAWVTCDFDGKYDSRDGPKESSDAAVVGKNSPAWEGNAELEAPCLWTSLSPELKNPPTQTLRVPEDPVLHPMPSLQVIMPSVHPELHELHPEPRLIYRFWQIFVESINPLTKVIHVPTMQERVLDASWNPEGIRTPLAAIMFAIYTLAVTASSSETCRAVFGELRGILLTRYRTAALRALVAAGFLETTELEVLQAWALLLFANPESDLCTALSGAAMSAARRMGLHRSGTDPSLSFFDTEMRIRLWWQLCGLEARAQANCSGGLQGPRFEVGDVRLPLNVNDSELHPDMVGSPAEHTGPTEMLFVLVKLAVTDWLRSSETATKAFGSIALAPVQDSATWTRPGDEVIDEIEQLYDARYLAAADKQIPLPALARATAQLAVARMRFRLHHPRRRRGVARGNPGDQPGRGPDVVFESALTIMEMLHQGRHSQFCGHLFTHMTSKPQLDACICVISELRRRCSGPRVDLAWELVEGLYLDHPELLTGSGSQGAFSVALRDLTLEAWDARQKKSAWRPGASAPSPTPGFVQMLLKERQEEGDQWPATMPEAGGAVESFGVAGDTSELDWDYWNDFLRL